MTEPNGFDPVIEQWYDLCSEIDTQLDEAETEHRRVILRRLKESLKTFGDIELRRIAERMAGLKRGQRPDEETRRMFRALTDRWLREEAAA